MDQTTKTKATPVPANQTGKGSGANSGSSLSGRGTYQKTVLMNDVVADPSAASANIRSTARRSSGIGSASPNLNLSSTSLSALSQRYDILSEAGHGNMGNVYKARDRETGETVALKLIKPEIASDQAMTERFKNELLFARKITHKNVCRVYEFNRIGGVAYTSMEFVEGESLRSVLSRFGGLPVRKGIDLTMQICSGLKEAHAQGIVHRDLKPENVMIDAQGNVKIMDFGIARSMEGGTRLTGAMIGTPAYMAPEQVSGKPVDYRTDIYALGLVLYEIFTGSEAFRADTPVAVALKQMQEAPAPPHDIEPAIPVYIERAILKCLEKDPAKRFQSIAELESALRSTRVTGAAAVPVPLGVARASAMEVSRASGPSYPMPLTAKPKRKSRTLPIALVAAAILLALGVLLAMNAAKKQAQTVPPVAAAPNPPAKAFVRPPQFARAEVANAASLAKRPAPPATSRNVAPPNAIPSAPEVFPRVEWGNQTLQPWQARSTPETFIWVGRFENEQRAQEVAKRMEEQNLPVAIQPRTDLKGQKFFVVFSGPYEKGSADEALQWLHDVGFANARAVRVGQNAKRKRN